MTNHPVVSRAEWLAARTAFLEKEKAFTRDELNRQRRELPGEKVDKAYNYIDLTPKGRDEGNRSQFWVRRHDEYDR
jgi:predicted dithiol-disulfide oxidoreductase (DUF899 family)